MATKISINPTDKYLPGAVIAAVCIAVFVLTWLLASSIKDVCIAQPDKCPTVEVQDERTASIAKAKAEADKKVSEARAVAAAAAASAPSK